MRGLLDDAVTITVHIAGKWLYRMRRVLATLCIGLLAASIGYKVVFGANGMKVWEGKRAEVLVLQQEIERKKAEHEELDRHVQALQRGDPSVIEKEAREQLGYVKPGEVVLFEQRSKPKRGTICHRHLCPEINSRPSGTICLFAAANCTRDPPVRR